MSFFISLDNKDFDLNSLFNFSHSYEILKQVISTIAKNNKKINYEVSDITDELKLKDDLIKDLFFQLSIEKEHNKKFVEETDNNFRQISDQLTSITKAYNNLSSVIAEKLTLDKPLHTLNEDGIDLSNIKNTLFEHIQNIENKTKEELSNFEKSHMSKKDLLLKKKDKERSDSEKKENKRLTDLSKKNTKNIGKISDFDLSTNKNKEKTDEFSERIIHKTIDRDTDADFFNKKKSGITGYNDNVNNSKGLEKTGTSKRVNIDDIQEDSGDRYQNNSSKHTENLNTNNKNTSYKGEENISSDNYQVTHNSNNNNKHADDRMNKIGNNQMKLEENINKLLKRIDKLEREIDETKYTGSNDKIAANRNSTLKILDLKKANDSTINLLDELKAKIMDLEVRGSNWDEKIQDLVIKSQDLDIYDALKSGGENTNFDQALILVQSLEKKIFKKFEFTDEKQRKLEEEQGKIRNEAMKTGKKMEEINNDLQATSLTLDKVIGDLENNNKLSSTNLRKDMESNKKIVAVPVSEDLEKRIEEKINELKNSDLITPHTDKLKSIIVKTIEDRVLEFVNPTIDNEMSKIKIEINKRYNDLDKQMKIMASNINIEKVNQEIAKINDSLQRKINLEDFSELKSNVNLISHQVTYLKDTLSQVVDDRKVLEDIAWLRKKVENLTSSMLSFKTTDDVGASSSKGGPNFDSSKYLEGSVFNTFHKNYVKDMEFIKQLVDINKKNIEDLSDKVKQRVSDDDMKNLEDYLVNRLEEMRIVLAKKFADKLDTQKSIKYIEAQVKHVVEVYVKKMEKGENWMLAKKPVNGYTCASCENYIGDLTDKACDFTAWNKYPARETSDKVYKVRN